MIFLFPANMILPFNQKSKDDLLPKNTIKDDISGITEKDSEKYGISSNRKIKDNKNIYLVKYT